MEDVSVLKREEVSAKISDFLSFFICIFMVLPRRRRFTNFEKICAGGVGYSPTSRGKGYPFFLLAILEQIIKL